MGEQRARELRPAIRQHLMRHQHSRCIYNDEQEEEEEEEEEDLQPPHFSAFLRFPPSTHTYTFSLPLACRQFPSDPDTTHREVSWWATSSRHRAWSGSGVSILKMEDNELTQTDTRFSPVRLVFHCQYFLRLILLRVHWLVRSGPLRSPPHPPPLSLSLSLSLSQPLSFSSYSSLLRKESNRKKSELKTF